MADSGVNINQVIKDSDEIEEISCEQCEKYIGKYIVATGLCLQCTEYMCSTCIEYHARYMPGHRIQNKSNMPQDICNVKCPNHSDKVIKFYCSACDKFACVICKTNQHNSCIAIAHLPAIVRDIENSKELNALEDVIEEISTDICKTNQQLVTNKNFVTNVEDTARSVVNEHQHRLVETYNKLQQESIEEFDKKMREIIEKLQKERREKIEAVTMKENQFKKKIDMAACREMRIVEEITNGEREKLSGLSKQNEAISTKIQSVKSDIELKKKTQQRCKLFMAMKAAEKQIDELKQSMCALRTNTEVQVQPFRIELNKIEMTIDQLDIRRSFFALKHIHVSNREKAVTYLYTLKLQQFEATSMCLLTKTQLLVADEKKESVLNFTDIDYRKDNFRVIKTSSKPAMVAKFAENEAVVTLPNLGLVTFLIFSSSTKLLIKTEDIKVSRSCHGIACCQEKLVVSFLKPPKIEVLNKAGENLMTFETDSANMPMFFAPKFLAVSPECTKVYVADTSKNNIICMTFDGKIESVYKERQQDVTQITVDLSGTVYLCGKDSNNVVQLSNDLIQVKTLLDSSNNISNPRSICSNKSMLLLGSNTLHKSSIKVFILSYE